MAFLTDGSPFVYGRRTPEPNTVAIGWLASGISFPTVVTPDKALLGALFYGCTKRPVRITCGWHRCDLCPPGSPYPVIERRRWRKATLGAAEIRVRGRNVIFAAPQLVYHYVAAHLYRPPAEFVEAVIARAFLGEPPAEPTLLPAPAGIPISLPPAEDLSIRSRFATLLLSRLAQPGERLDEQVSLVAVVLVPASWSDSGRPGLLLRLTLIYRGSTATDYEGWSESLAEQDKALNYLVDGVARERLLLWREFGLDLVTGKDITRESGVPPR